MSHSSWSRRDWLITAAGSLTGGLFADRSAFAFQPAKAPRELAIKEIRITPVVLPDPPILAASRCHGPYFLRSIIGVKTHGVIVGRLLT